MTSPVAPPRPRLTDLFFLSVLILTGGASFSGIRYAVETAEPGVVAAGRLWVAAIAMLIYAYGTDRRLPPLLTSQRLDKRWGFMIACGVVGYTIPFTLFPFAQQTIPSMLAGIYMAFMPLITVILARFFASEALTMRKLAGFVIGTGGVVFLIGFDALARLGDADVIAQFAMLLATTCYAAYAVTTKRAPVMPARSFAAGMLLCSAMAATPLALVSGQDWAVLSLRSMLAIIFLGLFPSALAAIMIINLIQRVGAGFMALGNYVTPLVAILFGYVLFDEPIQENFLIGLAIILAGLALAQLDQISSMGRGLQHLLARQKEMRPRK